MTDIEALFAAMEACDRATTYELVLKLLKAAAGEPDPLRRSAMIDIAFDSADWLFEEGRTLDGAKLYAAAMRVLADLREENNFELARRLDRMTSHLTGAGLPSAAREALKGAIDVTRADAGADEQAFFSRLRRLHGLEEGLGNKDGAETALDEAETLARKGPRRELSATAVPEASRGADAVAPEADQETAAVTPSLAQDLQTTKPSDKFIHVPIHFATHRMPATEAVGAADYPYSAYGHERSAKLNYGYADVTVPKERAKGDYKELEFGIFGNGGRKPETCFTISLLHSLPGEQALFSGVEQLVTKAERNELLVYVHGFSCSLASGLMRTAQLKVDMMIDGAAVLYSLPSKGRRGRQVYNHDVEEAQRTQAHDQFREFLVGLCEKTGARKIHLVGHSLGCDMLIRTLDNLATAEGPKSRRRFDEVIFAAPAVSLNNFREMLAKSAPLYRRATVYTSSRDLVLWAFGKWEGLPLAGYDASALEAIDKVDAIDTGADQSWLWSLGRNWGHADFADHAIDDLRGIVWLSLGARGRRRLIAPRPEQGNPTYWIVKAGNRQDIGVYLGSLFSARALGLRGAKDHLVNAIRIEAQKGAEGNQLAWFKALRDEVQLFIDNRIPEI